MLRSCPNSSSSILFCTMMKSILLFCCCALLASETTGENREDGSGVRHGVLSWPVIDCSTRQKKVAAAARPRELNNIEMGK
jgi:hypothetical protein